MNRLEHGRIRAGRVDIPRCSQPDTTGDGPRQVRDNVAEKVIRHDDIKARRVSDHINCRRVDVAIIHLGVGILLGNLIDSPLPQPTGIHEDIGFVHQR